MPFLSLNGVTIPVFKDSFKEHPVFTGDFVARGINGSLLESRSSRKRQWTFQTTVQRATIAEQYRMWIEGLGQGFSFNSIDTTNLQAYSRAGVGCAYTVTSLANTAAAKYGADCLGVASGEKFAFLQRNRVGRYANYAPTQGWTHIFWAYLTNASGETAGADGWYHHILKGSVSHDGASGANPAGVTQYQSGVTTTNKGRLITADGIKFGLWGKRATVADTSAQKDYDDWLVVPFEIDASWAPQIYSFAGSYPLGMPPCVKLWGDCISYESSPIEVVGRVDTIDLMVAKLPGASTTENNNKILNVTLHEV